MQQMQLLVAFAWQQLSTHAQLHKENKKKKDFYMLRAVSCIFERKLRSRPQPRACLPQRRLQIGHMVMAQRPKSLMNECMNVIAGYLSDSQPQELQQLLDALDQECPEDVVHYRDLFLEDSNLSQVRPTY